MQAGWGVELLVRAAETELQDEMLRGGVCRVMPGKEGRGADIFKGEFYDGTRRFFREAAPPERVAQMDPQFEDEVFDAVGTQARAADVLLRFEKENRPILDFEFGEKINFCVQPVFNFFR